MASIGHIAVGMAAARVAREAPRTVEDSDKTPPLRPGWRDWHSMLAWSALSLLPDADVIGFPLGVRYADPWGHRGATHSLIFAVAVATAVALLAPGRRRLRTWVIASVVLVSHGLLD